MIRLLDTDHVTVLQRGGAGVIALQNRLSLIAPDDYGTTIISYEEQCRGWLGEINAAQTPEARVASYAALKRSYAFFSRLALVDYDAQADAEFIALKKVLKNRVGTKDLRIAAIAIVNGATILTRNTRDFAQVPGLLFDDWTV